VSTPFGPVRVWDAAVGTIALALGVAFVLSLLKGVRQLKDVDAVERP
jgi:hypothetical protein